MEFTQGGQTRFAMFIQIFSNRRSKTEPARQHQPALRPRKDPRNRAQIGNRLRRAARGRARTDVEVGDFIDRRGFAEVGDEIRRGKHQIAVSLIGAHAEFFQQLMAFWRIERAGSCGREAGVQRGGNEDFQIAAADFRIGIFG